MRNGVGRGAPVKTYTPFSVATSLALSAALSVLDGLAMLLGGSARCVRCMLLLWLFASGAAAAGSVERGGTIYVSSAALGAGPKDVMGKSYILP